jgi:hypothetical protein
VEIANLLETFPGGTNAANAYRAFGTTVSAADAAVQSAGRLAEQAAGRRVVRLGAWLQAARFAAAAQDTAYFSGSVPRAISRAAIAMDGRAGAESAAHQLEQIARQRPHDWIALGTAVEELLRLLGTS